MTYCATLQIIEKHTFSNPIDKYPVNGILYGRCFNLGKEGFQLWITVLMEMNR